MQASDHPEGKTHTLTHRQIDEINYWLLCSNSAAGWGFKKHTHTHTAQSHTRINIL